jgi:hypothetical protein
MGTPRRRRLKFSLSAVFILMAVACVWLGMQVKWIRDRNAALLKTAAHSSSTSEWKVVRRQKTTPKAIETTYQRVQAEAPWSIRILGEKGVASINPGEMPEAEIKELQQLFPEAEVSKTVQPPGRVSVGPEIPSTSDAPAASPQAPAK